MQAEVPLQPKMWYFMAATLDAKTGRAPVHQNSAANRYNSHLSKVVPLTTALMSRKFFASAKNIYQKRPF